jgi:hypothetical protein
MPLNSFPRVSGRRENKLPGLDRTQEFYYIKVFAEIGQNT